MIVLLHNFVISVVNNYKKVTDQYNIFIVLQNT